MHETTEMRKRAYLLPRDSMVHKLPVAKNGEHQFAAYSEEDNDQKILFFDDDLRKIQNFWAVPSYSEIMSIESGLSEFTKLNLGKLYKFDLGKPGEKDEYGRAILSEFIDNNQKSLVKSRLPVLTPVDLF